VKALLKLNSGVGSNLVLAGGLDERLLFMEPSDAISSALRVLIDEQIPGIAVK
jgi:hypothetical protein